MDSLHDPRRLHQRLADAAHRPRCCLERGAGGLVHVSRDVEVHLEVTDVRRLLVALQACLRRDDRASGVDPHPVALGPGQQRGEQALAERGGHQVEPVGPGVAAAMIAVVVAFNAPLLAEPGDRGAPSVKRLKRLHLEQGTHLPYAASAESKIRRYTRNPWKPRIWPTWSSHPTAASHSGLLNGRSSSSRS